MGATNCWLSGLNIFCHVESKIGTAELERKKTMNGNNGNDAVIGKLTDSAVYQDYERAFSDATGLPMSLRPVESWQLPLRGKRNENPFCSLMAQKSRSCAACLQTQQKLADGRSEEHTSELQS